MVTVSVCFLGSTFHDIHHKHNSPVTLSRSGWLIINLSLHKWLFRTRPSYILRSPISSRRQWIFASQSTEICIIGIGRFACKAKIIYKRFHEIITMLHLFVGFYGRVNVIIDANCNNSNVEQELISRTNYMSLICQIRILPKRGVQLLYTCIAVV